MGPNQREAIELVLRVTGISRRNSFLGIAVSRLNGLVKLLILKKRSYYAYLFGLKL